MLTAADIVLLGLVAAVLIVVEALTRYWLARPRRRIEPMGAEYDRIEREVREQWERMKAENEAFHARVEAHITDGARRTGHRVRL